MGSYSSASGIRYGYPDWTSYRFTVSSPSRAATTIEPSSGSTERSTTKMSSSWMPAPVIESPVTRTKKVASSFLTSSRLRSSEASTWSSAGEGNPAGTLD